MEEFDFAMGLFHQDGKLDLSEFIALELLRLGKVEMGTLDSIRREFDQRAGCGPLASRWVVQCDKGRIDGVTMHAAPRAACPAPVSFLIRAPAHRLCFHVMSR